MRAGAIDQALGAFELFARNNETRLTKTRLLVARAALSYPGHFTVQDLVDLVRDTGGPSAGRVTVYRTVHLLLNAQLIEPAPSVGDIRKYERSFGKSTHAHLVCKVCGEVQEFDCTTLDSCQHDVARRHGFDLTGHRQELRGYCSRCARSETGARVRAGSARRAAKSRQPLKQ
jgi:Fur family transcriptional regulator, ferric uptake regulator